MIHLSGNFYICYGSLAKRRKIACSVCGDEPQDLTPLAYDMRGWLAEQDAPYDKRKMRRYCPKPECRGEQLNKLVIEAVERLGMTDSVKV